MSLTVNLKKKVHRKIWEPIFTPIVAATVAGSVFAKHTLPIPLGDDNQAYYISGLSNCYQYAANEEAFGQLPNSGSAGTFGTGAAAYHHPVGSSFTASAGSTTGFTSTLTIPRDMRGYRFRCTGGTNKGVEGIIKSNTWGANSVITTQDTYAGAFDNTSVITLMTGRLWYYCPGATSGFNVYDWALNTWTAKNIGSGPAITTNEGCLIGTPAAECPTELSTATAGAVGLLTDTTRNWPVNSWKNSLIYILSGLGAGQYRYVASNTATTVTPDVNWGTAPDATSVYTMIGQWSDIASAGSTTTITSTIATPWTASQWIGYQVRAVAGTGAGQVAVITANTNAQLTFGAVGTGFDNTTRFVIENNDDALYFLGGAAVTLSKYTISGNTWSTLAPGAARSAAPAGGASGNFLGDLMDTLWRGVGAAAGGPNGPKCNGRYIYSFRGSAGGVLDVYDIPANTWVSSWSYGGVSNETFTTGTTWVDEDGFIWGQKDATGRFFRFDASKNELIPIGTNNVVQGAAVGGSRLLVDKYWDITNGKFVRWLTWQLNTSQQMMRMLDISTSSNYVPPVAPLWNQ